ncbi:ABC transporter ATP-binding protein [Caldiplasma sukawensis]
MNNLKVNSITKKYGKFLAVDNISFELDGMMAVGYLGPNGAGKSTSFKIMTGLINATSGSVRINNYDIRKERVKALLQVGSMIETPEPYPAFTVEDAMLSVGILKNISKKDVMDHMETFGKRIRMPPYDRKIKELSRGQRARVVMAAAFLGDPSIVFLDEPTNGMDPVERRIITDVILEQKKERLIFLSSHLLPEVTETCDEVIMLNHGKLVLRDTTKNIQSKFGNKEVEIKFLKEIDEAELKRELGELVSNVEHIEGNTYLCSYNGEIEVRAEILEKALRIGKIYAFQDHGSSLEDAFISLLKE